VALGFGPGDIHLFSLAAQLLLLLDAFLDR
jgi:hypothetical protein